MNDNQIFKKVEIQNTDKETPQTITVVENPFKLLIILSGLLAAFLLIFYACSSDSSNSTAKKAKCEWCGKYKSCHKYQVTQLDGYNKDGSYKYKTTYVWICDGCRDDAEKNGIEYGWVSITQTDT